MAKLNKRAMRRLRLCRKTKVCNLRINEKCKSCEYIEFCLNNRQERKYMVEQEREAQKRNVQKAKAAAKADDFYDNEVALDDSYDDNDFESYDESDDVVESCESCDDNDNNEATRKCHPYEFACPYIEECDGNCVYDGG